MGDTIRYRTSCGICTAKSPVFQVVEGDPEFGKWTALGWRAEHLLNEHSRWQRALATLRGWIR